MKSWLKVIRGEVEKKSEEIVKEVSGIEQQVQESQTKAEALRDQLKQAGIECLGGGGSEKAITKLESDIQKLDRDVILLEEVKKSLREKLDDAIAREGAERVVQINKEIEALRASRKEFDAKAWALAADLAGLLYLSQGTHEREILNIMRMGHDERIRFRVSVKKFVDGQIPLRDQERLLARERDELKG
jgi:predicted RNase H-like nuclease (RuvC/YqgF family)